MLKAILLAALLAAATPALAQAPAAPPAATPSVLTVDSTLRDLVLNPRTRPVIEKHMPGFAERLETDPELAERFGGISLAGLQLDPHARGVTPAALARIGAELAEAQKPT